MIGGVENQMIAPPLEDAFEEILLFCRRRWPDGVFLDADETDLLPLIGPKLAWRLPSQEFFVFSDQETAEKWDDLGPCPENWNRMFHFLCRAVEGLPRRATRVTLVVDKMTPDMGQLLNDLQSTFWDGFFFAQPQAEAA